MGRRTPTQILLRQWYPPYMVIYASHGGWIKYDSVENTVLSKGAAPQPGYTRPVYKNMVTSGILGGGRLSWGEERLRKESPQLFTQIQDDMRALALKGHMADEKTITALVVKYRRAR